MPSAGSLLPRQGSGILGPNDLRGHAGQAFAQTLCCPAPLAPCTAALRSSKVSTLHQLLEGLCGLDNQLLRQRLQGEFALLSGLAAGQPVQERLSECRPCRPPARLLPAARACSAGRTIARARPSVHSLRKPTCSLARLV